MTVPSMIRMAITNYDPNLQVALSTPHSDVASVTSMRNLSDGDIRYIFPPLHLVTNSDLPLISHTPKVEWRIGCLLVVLPPLRAVMTATSAYIFFEDRVREKNICGLSMKPKLFCPYRVTLSLRPLLNCLRCDSHKPVTYLQFGHRCPLLV